MTTPSPVRAQTEGSTLLIERSGIWDELKSILDIQQCKPKQASGVTASKEMTDKIGRHFILKNGDTHSYIRLSPEEFWVWEKLDGDKSIQQLVVAYYNQYKAFAFAPIFSLTERLREASMLCETPQHLYADITTSLKEQSFFHKFTWLARSVFTKEFEIKNLDARLENIHRYGGWLLFTLPVQIIFLLIATIGTGLFFLLVYDPQYNLLNPNTAIQLGLLSCVPLIVHEFGHAITAKHMGCEVYKGGAMLYYGLPAVFVDTTDIWMFGKRARLAVTWAGPYTGYIIGGVCSSIVYLFRGLSHGTAVLLLQLALASISFNTFNILPLLKLDGYYLISDALEIPRLRERSMEFIKRELKDKFSKRASWTREEVIFLVFGILAFLSTFYFTYTGIVFWDRQAGKSISELLNLQSGDFAKSFLNTGMLLLAVSTILYSLSLIASRANRIIKWLQGRRLLSTRFSAAFFILLGTMIFSFIPRMVFTSLATWLVPIIGSGAFILAAWLALSKFIEMRGSIHAKIWPAIAFGTLVGAGSFIGEVNANWSEAALRLYEAGLVLIVIGFILTSRLLFGLHGSWREVSLGVMALGGITWTISLIMFSEWRVELRTLAGLLTLGGLLHWDMRPETSLKQRAGEISGSTREKLAYAFTFIKSIILSELDLDFGMQTRIWMESGVYSSQKESMEAAEFSKTIAGMTPNDYGGAMALKLNKLINSVERVAGKKYVWHALALGYDRLDWELQEIIEDYILKYVRRAKGLSNALTAEYNDMDTLLRSVPLFINLTDEDLSMLKNCFISQHFERGGNVLCAGQEGDSFYLIRAGRADVLSADGQILENYGRGDYFGEDTLLSNVKHKATVRASIPLETLVLSRRHFEDLVRNKVKFDEKTHDEIQRLGILRQIPLFEKFKGSDLKSLAKILKKNEVESGQVVFKQGEHADSFYIIESGKVSVQIDGQERAVLSTGEYFGEIALMMDIPRTATTTAIQATTLLQLRAGEFMKLTQNSSAMKEALERVSSRRALSNRRWILSKDFNVGKV